MIVMLRNSYANSRFFARFVQYQKSDFSMMFFENISVESSQRATSLYVCDISHCPFLTSQPPNYRNNTLRNLKLIHAEFGSTNENIMTWNLLNFNYADYILGPLCVCVCGLCTHSFYSRRRNIDVHSIIICTFSHMWFNE